MLKKNHTSDYTSDTQERDNSTSIKLLEQKLEFMQQTLNEIKDSIANFMTEVKDGFVTKEEFNSLKKDVRDLQDIKAWGVKIVIGGVIIGLLALLGIRQ